METPEAIAAVDALLASVGMEHGRRATRTAAALRSGNGARKARPATATRRNAGSPLDILKVPGWQRFPWLVHGFSTRTGGASTAYSQDRATGELNLGRTEPDSPASVEANRKRFFAEIGAQAGPVTLRQIHSANIYEAGPALPQKPCKGDGAITATAGVTLAIQTADCIPVLLVDPDNHAVGAFHAGWRGTVRRIVERGVGDMRRAFGSNPAHLMAAIGPGIGQCCYAVGDDVIAEFTSQFAYATELFREFSESDPIKLKYPLLFLTARAPGHSNLGPQIHLDLWKANRRQLLDAGLKAENIWVAEQCTACNRERFFSYRAEHGYTGRMMAAVGIRNA